MKTLYLVRHAKSSWDFPHLRDADRPLNGRGEKNAPEMASRLKKMNILPDQIKSSPARRAMDTCIIFSDILGYSTGKIIEDRRIYHASEEDLLEVIKETDDHINSLMLFGHNPGFNWLAQSLTEQDLGNIPTCGIVASKLNITTWKDIGSGTGELVFFDYPKKAQ